MALWGSTMTDPATELASLVADLRAVLQDARDSGVTDAPVEVIGAGEANNTDSLAAVREEMGDCQRCALAGERNKLVFGVGDASAELVIIGEAPGFEEDKSGVPFVGPAGTMLDRMLENVIGITRQQTYILNIVKCRPPSNRNPLPDEVAACLPFLEKQVDAIDPTVILLLGSVALKTLLGTQAGIVRHRGTWMEYRGIPVMPTFHPAYLLRNAGDKRKTFEDLKALKRRMDELSG
jgi:uracil-DNA glycosylase